MVENPEKARPPRVLVSAGDPSGDLILAKVIAELKTLHADTGIYFTGLCGPRSLAEGVVPIGSTRDVAVVGLVEVLRKLPKIFHTLGLLGRELANVDSVLCVDFPDFNLKLAQMAAKMKKPVDYIVAPQVWAWRSKRMPVMRKLLRRLYPALPFEESLFREAGVDAVFLGHPVRDLLPPKSRREAREEFGFALDDFVLCLMPGSRHSEVARHLPLLLEAWKENFKQGQRYRIALEKWKIVLPLAPGWSRQNLLELLSSRNKKLLSEMEASGLLRFSADSRTALMASDFGWIASGTATLEAAYYGLPHILIYKLSSISAFLLKRMSSYLSSGDMMAGLPNILLERRVIPELIQNHLSAKRLSIETLELLSNGTALTAMKRDLRWIPRRLGEHGATERIAQNLKLLWQSA